MRRALDALYDGCAALAALFMVALLAAVLLSVLGRQLHFNIPGIDAYAGYLMAGAGFLALAQTLKRGEHIRVTLLLAALHGSSRRALELWALAAATALSALAAFYSARLAAIAAVRPSQTINNQPVNYTNMFAELTISVAQTAGSEPTLKELILGIHWDEQPIDPVNGRPGYFVYTYVSADSNYTAGGH